jgi:hypothetical protein
MAPQNDRSLLSIRENLFDFRLRVRAAGSRTACIHAMGRMSEETRLRREEIRIQFEIPQSLQDQPYTERVARFVEQLTATQFDGYRV